MKDFYIADAAQFESQVITSYFALAQISAREKKGGSGQYLALTLADKTGQFEARMWENFAEALATCAAGCYVKVQGRIDKYQGRFQITVEKMRVALESEVDVADFQPHTQYDIDALWMELLGYVERFKNEHLKRLVMAFLEDPELGPAFRVAPAAKSLHHAWIGGLLEHVVFLLRLAERVVPHYPEVDADLVMAGAILHDFGKVKELAWKSSFSYTTEGQLLGHITIVIGLLHDKVRDIEGFPERLRILMEHLILSHHGRLEFGSPKLPMIPEAIVFSAIDDLEAKMQNMRAEFQRAKEAGKAPDEVTDYSRSMERNLLDSAAYRGGE